MASFSFVSHVKIGPGYEDYKERAIYYINHIHYFCTKYKISYEIIIIEHIDSQNVFLLYKNIHKSVEAVVNVTIIPIAIDSYPNPLNFNMIEYNGANLALLHTKNQFVAINNIDIIYDERFFEYAHTLKPKTLYRLTTYSIKNIETKSLDFEEHQGRFKKNTISKLLIPPDSRR